MKIIFLDIDGVLCVIPYKFDEWGGDFHEHFVDNLRRIIDETGAKIVISSSWKGSGLKSLQSMWKSRNLPGEVIDITPFADEVVRRSPNLTYYDDVMRGDEIRLWIELHIPDLTDYVIIDDDDDMLPHQMPHFVKTSGNYNHPDKVDIGYGLTDECTDNVIRILNG